MSQTFCLGDAVKVIAPQPHNEAFMGRVGIIEKAFRDQKTRTTLYRLNLDGETARCFGSELESADVGKDATLPAGTQPVITTPVISLPKAPAAPVHRVLTPVPVPSGPYHRLPIARKVEEESSSNLHAILAIKKAAVTEPLPTTVPVHQVMFCGTCGGEGLALYGQGRCERVNLSGRRCGGALKLPQFVEIEP